jgi:hypothetical protein
MAGAGGDGMKVRRVFTRDDRTSYLSCQYIKWVLVFKNRTQEPKAISCEGKNVVRAIELNHLEVR